MRKIRVSTRVPKRVIRVGSIKFIDMNPNDPLWPIFLYILIHRGDPGPDDRVLRNVLNALVIKTIASQMPDEASKKTLNNVSAGLLKSFAPAHEFAG